MKDTYVPKEKWEFDQGVARVFDDMLERSIPQYTIMRDLVYNLACEYVQPRTDIVDVGCSRGNAIERLSKKFGKTNTFIGIDVSEAMLHEIEISYPDLWKEVAFRHIDLRYGYIECNASVTLCVLTLQFIPIEYRQYVLKQIYNTTTKGGVIIVVEKVLGYSHLIDSAFVDQYYALKEKNGYCKEDIIRKRLSLEGILVPVTAKWNEELLHMAGFDYIDCFWRFLNFAGWIGIKA